MTEDALYIFKDRVWFTRKAWIAAEKRLLDNEYHTQLLLVFYAAYTTCISIILLAHEFEPEKKRIVDTSMVVLSVVLLGLSLYLNSKSFKERAAGFKGGYLNLYDIENQLTIMISQFESSCLSNSNVKDFEKLSESYTKILRDVENHLQIDDISSRVSAGEGLRTRHVTFKENISFYCWKLNRRILLTVMYVSPILVFIYNVVG